MKNNGNIETIEEKVSSTVRNNKNGGGGAPLNVNSIMVNKVNGNNKSKDNSIINEYLSKGAPSSLKN